MFRTLDWFLPAEFTDDQHRRQRGRVLVAAAMFLALAIPMGVTVRLSIASLPPAVLAIDLACSVVFAAIPWWVRATGSLTAGGVAATVSLYLLIIVPSFWLGGLEAPILMAVPSLPLLVSYLVGWRFGVGSVVFMIASICLLMLAPSWGVPIAPLGLDAPKEGMARALILGVTTAFAGLLASLAVKQRIDAERRYRKSYELYRRVFAQSRDIVALSSPQGKLVDINPAGVEFYGFASKDEMLGRSVEQGYVDPAQRRVLLAKLATQGYVQDYETEHRTSAGERRTLAGTTSTISGEGGEIELLLAILRDVTERKRVAAEREDMLADLTSKNAELERFTYAVSHDLKAPLATVRGLVYLFLKEAAHANGEQFRSYGGRLSQAVDTMARMIDDLLELSQIGHQSVALNEVSLNAVVRDVLDLLEGRISNAGTEMDLVDTLPSVYGDRVLLLTIFQNLIDNAVKFSASKSQPRVHINGWSDGDKVHCRVTDNGVGIPEHEQKRVFELFQRLDHEASGTGVGLASVRRAVEVLGGEIWIEPTDQGEGSTFCVTLPAVATDTS